MHVGGLGDFDGVGEIFLEVFVDDVSLGIDESGVEMALEHCQDALDGGIGRDLLRIEGDRRVRRKEECGSGRGEGFNEFSTLHEESPLKEPVGGSLSQARGPRPESRQCSERFEWRNVRPAGGPERKTGRKH